MKIFNWQPGRQKGCDYLKFPLWFFELWKLGTDAYILKYSQNSILNPHIDPVGNGKHYRLNIGWGYIKNLYVNKSFFNLESGCYQSIYLDLICMNIVYIYLKKPINYLLGWLYIINHIYEYENSNNRIAV